MLLMTVIRSSLWDSLCCALENPQYARYNRGESAKKVWGGSFPEMMKLSEYKAMLCVHLKSKIIYGDIENLA